MVVLKERRRFQERKRLNARILVLQKERRRKEDEERERREKCGIMPSLYTASGPRQQGVGNKRKTYHRMEADP